MRCRASCLFVCLFAIGWLFCSILAFVPFALYGTEVFISMEEVEAAQQLWGDSIAAISKVYLDGGDYVAAAGEAAGKLYGYGHSQVLFKPTKAAEYPFRPTGAQAMSYFVGGAEFEDGYEEDGGFAINGGKGWKEVVFKNHQIQLHGTTAIAMGTYDFTCATTGDVATVEYTFGYKRNKDGKARIFLHHSSVPYSAAPAAAGPKVIAQMIPGARAIGA